MSSATATTMTTATTLQEFNRANHTRNPGKCVRKASDRTPCVRKPLVGPCDRAGRAESVPSKSVAMDGFARERISDSSQCECVSVHVCEPASVRVCL